MNMASGIWNEDWVGKHILFYSNQEKTKTQKNHEIGNYIYVQFSQGYVKSTTSCDNIAYHNIVRRDLDHVAIPQNNRLIQCIEDVMLMESEGQKVAGLLEALARYLHVWW